jgi:hypothetical protein
VPRGRRGRTADQIAAQRADVARWYSTGRTLGWIANKQGLSLRQVKYDLKAIREEWRRDRVEYTQHAIDQELAKIDAAEAQAWRGWRRSLRDAETKTTKTTADDETTVVKGQSGDPRFLTVVLTCVERRAKLLGLDAATKIDLTLDDLRHLNDEQLKAIAEGNLPRDAGEGGAAAARPPA